jgi:hypothetical protein
VKRPEDDTDLAFAQDSSRRASRHDVDGRCNAPLVDGVVGLKQAAADSFLQVGRGRHDDRAGAAVLCENAGRRSRRLVGEPIGHRRGKCGLNARDSRLVCGVHRDESLALQDDACRRLGSRDQSRHERRDPG